MMAQKAAKNKEVKLRGHNKRPNRVDVTKIGVTTGGGADNNNPDTGGGNTGTNSQPPAKMPRMKPPGDPLDPNSSDHVVAMTQLKEQMASLQKQLAVKDSTILTKDKLKVIDVLTWHGNGLWATILASRVLCGRLCIVLCIQWSVEMSAAIENPACEFYAIEDRVKESLLYLASIMTTYVTVRIQSIGGLKIVFVDKLTIKAGPKGPDRLSGKFGAGPMGPIGKQWITELKAKHFTTENELRIKMNNSQKDHDKKVEMLHTKIKTLQKEVATLSKSTKKERLAASSGGGSGSGTDSPSIP
ncbi:Protein fam76b [Homalodisca vitripennis]|nr:Protein fam76b [Homalodisca vitripennis]